MSINGDGTLIAWLSYHGFVGNQVRLHLFILGYNLGNFLRRLALPEAVRDWSLRSLQVKLVKIGGRLVRHARRLVFQLADVAVPRKGAQGHQAALRLVAVVGGRC